MKAVRVAVTPEAMKQIFVEGYEIHVKVTHGTPKTARLVKSYYDSAHTLFVWVLEDESFEDIHIAQDDYDMLPMKTVVFEKIDS